MNNSTTQTISRRETLAKAGILGAGAAAFLLAAKSSHAQAATDKPLMTAAAAPAPQMTAATGDLDTVRFALGLERLEASFYAQVAMAHQKRAYLPARSLELMQKIATAKAAHVGALEGVLTGAGQELPNAMNYQFPAQVFQSPITFAWFAYTLEEIGIGAYLGAVGSLDKQRHSQRRRLDLRRQSAARRTAAHARRFRFRAALLRGAAHGRSSQRITRALYDGVEREERKSRSVKTLRLFCVSQM